MSKSNVTRGYGLLEGFLAKQRAKMADKLIPSIYRGGRSVVNLFFILTVEVENGILTSKGR